MKKILLTAILTIAISSGPVTSAEFIVNSYVGEIVGASIVSVRSGPGPEFDRIGVLNQGQKVEVVAHANGWREINNFTGNGRYFVWSDYITSSITSSQSDSPAPSNAGETFQLSDEDFRVHNFGEEESKRRKHVARKVFATAKLLSELALLAGKNTPETLPALILLEKLHGVLINDEITDSEIATSETIASEITSSNSEDGE